MRSADLTVQLPAERIASRPRPICEDLLLVVDRARSAVEHHRFTELPQTKKIASEPTPNRKHAK